jgi:hypothetical protein
MKMIKSKQFSVLLALLSLSGLSKADVTISSPYNTTLTFSQPKKGEHYYINSWKKLYFSRQGNTIDLSRKDRHYEEVGTSPLSPSGRYFIVTSISSGYIEFDDGKKEYTEKAYCSVVDMTSGCIVSDWDGMACGYSWLKDEDVLANTEGTDIFDFNSMRPSVNDLKNNTATMDNSQLANILRCDAPSKENIDTYQELVTKNARLKKVAMPFLLNYLNGIAAEATVKIKTNLFASPDVHSQTSAYLIPGDKVKVIRKSPDKRWLNIGYISKKGIPFIAWISTDNAE